METGILNNPMCFANYMGLWLIEPMWFQNALQALKSGLILAKNPLPLVESSPENAEAPKDKGAYYITKDRVALIGMSGELMKAPSKYGGTSTINVRKALRLAVRDGDVASILLVIDSPGGTASGTEELANDVRALGQQKPIHAHIDDLGASAAYWVASQAKRITANATASIGSIGVVAVVDDTSKKAEMEGVKVHVISTGPYKGSFVDGAPITEEHLTYLQDRVDGINSYFLKAVSEGRGLDMKEVKSLADGKVYLASEAKKLGMIDSISSLDEAVMQLGSKYKDKKRVQARDAELGLRILENS